MQPLYLTPNHFLTDSEEERKKKLQALRRRELDRQKPSPGSMAIHSNRLSFFDTPTEPVRIDPWSFLGLPKAPVAHSSPKMEGEEEEWEEEEQRAEQEEELDREEMVEVEEGSVELSEEVRLVDFLGFNGCLTATLLPYVRSFAVFVFVGLIFIPAGRMGERMFVCLCETCKPT